MHNVWSRVGEVWIVVDSGTKKQAARSAQRRNEAAERIMPDGQAKFVALPEGEVPEEDT